MAKRVAVVGSGQTNHTSDRRDVNGVELINEAVKRALENTGLTRNDIDAVVIGNMDHFEGINYVDMWSVDGSGGLDKPILKVTTGGTTGSTVAICAFHHVASGMFDTVLAIGWEKNSESDTTGAIITAFDPIWDRPAFAGAVGGLAMEATRYMDAYGAKQEDAARVAVRDRRHAMKNPHAHLKADGTVEMIMATPMLSWPVKLGDICPRTDGACAVIFAAEGKAEKLASKPAWIHGCSTRRNRAMASDMFMERFITLEEAGKELYKKTGIKEPLKEIDVCELYLPCSFCGLGWMEALQFCGPGKAPELIASGATDFGGEMPVNMSGGVLSSNPIGATALIRVAEGALQISGQAGERQVEGAKTALCSGFGGCYWSDLVLFRDVKPE